VKSLSSLKLWANHVFIKNKLCLLLFKKIPKTHDVPEKSMTENLHFTYHNQSSTV
jgi:hypothetical protein